MSLFWVYVTVRVLLVEPNRLFSEILVCELSKLSVDVTISPDINSALSAIGNLEYSLVVISYHLKEGTYEDFVRVARKRPEMSAVPIYLITTENSERLINQAYLIGVTGVYQKSEMEGLLQSIHRVHAIRSVRFSGTALLVEDSISVAQLVSSYLRDLGFDVLHCTHPKEAIEIFGRQSVDIVILDLLLDQGESGYKVINGIRCCHDQEKANTPILITTGFDDPSRRIDVYNLGADDYISKPIYKEELIVRISYLMTQAKNLKTMSLRKKVLEEYALFDPISKLYNRYGFKEASTIVINYAARNEHYCALILIDIDHFKNINDQFGHDSGDQCIADLGTFLRRQKRKHDAVARWGGDEFIVLLANCSVEDADLWFDKLNLDYKSHCSKQVYGSVSLSGGIVMLEPEANADLNEQVKMADEALYQAKKNGRDGSVVYQK